MADLVAVGSPESLKNEISGDCLHLDVDDAESLAGRIAERFHVSPAVVEGRLRIERPRAHELVPELVEAFPEAIRSVSLSKPSLEEVFIQRTGHRFELERDGG